MSSNTCPIANTLSLFTGKWKLLIIQLLLDDATRFNELARLIPGISSKVLTQQLREMEDDGLVERVIYFESPPRVEYKLTTVGRSAVTILREIRRWGLFNMLNNQSKLPDCGTCNACEKRGC